MNPLDELRAKRRDGGFNTKSMLKDDREWIVCFTCRRKHPLRNNNADHDAQDFAVRHPHQRGCICARINPQQMEMACRRAEGRKRLKQYAVAGFLDNASVLEAFQAKQSMDLTAVGIAVSATAGWCSAWVDNHTNLYLDILWYVNFAAVNTVASAQKALYFYTPGSFASGDLPSNTAGNTVTNSASTSATLTYLDITANPVGFPLGKVVPYITTNKAINSGGLFGTAKGHDGICPLFAWLGLVNEAGPTLTSTGSVIDFSGQYLTVV